VGGFAGVDRSIALWRGHGRSCRVNRRGYSFSRRHGFTTTSSTVRSNNACQAMKSEATISDQVARADRAHIGRHWCPAPSVHNIIDASAGFRLQGNPATRRDGIEVAVEAGGRHVKEQYEGWIAADLFRGGVRPVITGPQGFERAGNGSPEASRASEIRDSDWQTDGKAVSGSSPTRTKLLPPGSSVRVARHPPGLRRMLIPCCVSRHRAPRLSPHVRESSTQLVVVEPLAPHLRPTSGPTQRLRS
jgi:hypothetical protein